jgi:hypothetical protein
VSEDVPTGWTTMRLQRFSASRRYASISDRRCCGAGCGTAGTPRNRACASSESRPSCSPGVGRSSSPTWTATAYASAPPRPERGGQGPRPLARRPRIAAGRRLQPGVGWSVLEDGQVELAEAFGDGEDVDLHDLAVPDRKGHDREGAPTPSHDGTRGAVDERRPYERGKPRERERLRGTVVAPRTTTEAPGRSTPPSDRNTMSGSSTATRASCWVVLSLLWCAGIVAVFSSVAVARFARTR